MKFRFRLRLRKAGSKRSRPTLGRLQYLHHQDEDEQSHQTPIALQIDETHQQSNNMAHINDGSGDDQSRLWKEIPSPVDEQQIANAQAKVDRMMTLISDAYEKTLVRNLRLEELDVRSTDLFRDAEKMKNMAHKMQDKFFWEDSELIRWNVIFRKRSFILRILFIRGHRFRVCNCTRWSAGLGIYS